MTKAEASEALERAAAADARRGRLVAAHAGRSEPPNWVRLHQRWLERRAVGGPTKRGHG